jgi:hypothetical protein
MYEICLPILAIIFTVTWTIFKYRQVESKSRSFAHLHPRSRPSHRHPQDLHRGEDVEVAG